MMGGWRWRWQRVQVRKGDDGRRVVASSVRSSDTGEDKFLYAPRSSLEGPRLTFPYTAYHLFLGLPVTPPEGAFSDGRRR